MNVRRVLVGAALAAGALLPQAASAQTDPYERPTTEVKAAEFETRPTEVQGVQVQQGGLAVTGGDIAQLTLIGFGLVGAGVVLVRRNRTRSNAVVEA